MKRLSRLYLLIITILFVAGYIGIHAHPFARLALAKKTSVQEKQGSTVKTASNHTSSKQTQGQTAQSTLDGKPAPSFQLPTLVGETKTLSSYKGKAVLLVSWATWCTECRQELANLKATDQKHGLPYKVVLVNMTSEELSIKNVKNYVKKNKLSFPVMLDQKGKFESAYRVRVIPTSFLVDEYGNLLHTFYGPVTQKAVQTWLPTNS